MSWDRTPRPLSGALRDAVAPLAPKTPLARVQAVWADAVGERVAAEAAPVAERDGVVTVACRSASWAQQLDLLAAETLSELRDRLPEGTVSELRFRADGERF
jgi:predicted nucleic acid-binding Zn ribbon protein